MLISEELVVTKEISLPVSDAAILEGVPAASALDPTTSRWLSGEATVQFDQQPPLLDESGRRRVSELPNGTREVGFECERCAKMFGTQAQLTGAGSDLVVRI